MKLRVVLEYDDVVNSWSAYCPELPGINSCGATQEEAAALFFEPSDFLLPEKSQPLGWDFYINYSVSSYT